MCVYVIGNNNSNSNNNNNNKCTLLQSALLWTTAAAAVDSSRARNIVSRIFYTRRYCARMGFNVMTTNLTFLEYVKPRSLRYNANTHTHTHTRNAQLYVHIQMAFTLFD